MAKKAVSKHWKTHTKPYKCDYAPEHCFWEGAAEKRELNAHIRICHQPRGGEIYVCSCGKEYSLEKNLVRHQKEKGCAGNAPEEQQASD